MVSSIRRDPPGSLAELTRSGAFVELPRLDHAFTAHASIAESLGAYGRGAFGSEVVQQTVPWVRALAC